MATENHFEPISRAVQAHLGWTRSQIRIEPIEGIRLPGCSFYAVQRVQSTLHEGHPYVVLHDGRVLGAADEGTAAAILAACLPENGTASSWAEVLLRFQPGLGPGLVLHERNQAPVAVQRLEAGGKHFAPPAMKVSGGKLQLRFLIHEVQSGVLTEVEAQGQPGIGWEVHESILG